MKLEKIEVLKAFLASWLDYWVLQAIAFTILALQENASYNFWGWGLLSFYPFILYLLRRRFAGFGGFLLSHLGLMALLLILPAGSTMERVLFALYVVGYAIYSFYIRMNTAKWQDRAMPILVAGGILTVLVFVLYYFKRADLEIWFVIFCVCYLVLYFTYSYMLEYIHFVKVNEGSAGYIPVRKMFLAGLKAVIPYSLISGVLLLVLGNLSLITDVFKVLGNFLLWLLKLLFANAGDSADFQETQSENPFQQMAEGMEKMEGEAFWLWELLEKIMVVAIIALIVIVVVKVYKMVSEALKNIFSRSVEKSSEVKEELVDKREKCKIETKKKTQNKKHLLSMLSNKERIRKVYKKKIENARKTAGYHNFLKEEKTVDVCEKKSSTARECCESLSAEPLALIYEKARYSNLECDSGDVRDAKKWQ